MTGAGKELLKSISRCLSAYYEAEGILPEEQFDFRPRCLAIDMMFVVRRLQENGQRQGIHLCRLFNDLPEACDSGYRAVLWALLQCFGVPAVLLPSPKSMMLLVRARV